MTATVCESAMREGDAGRSAAAQVSIVSRERRKVYAGVLAVLACVAVIAVVGTGEGPQGGTELLGVSAAAHSRSVLQQLLADVERVTSDVGGEFSLKAEQPVELEEAKKPCNAACKQRKQEIAARMKALRDQINHDFKAMTSFGHKVGYLPPPQSIKAQVMSGTLLHSAKEPVAPPPFSPTLTVKASKSSDKSSGKAAPAPAAPSPAPSPSVSTGDSSADADAAPPKDPPALPDTSTDSSSTLSASSDDSSDDANDDTSSDDSSSSDDAGASSSGSSNAWAKAFAFIHHTDNPVVGDSKSRSDAARGDVHHGSRARNKEDPLKAAEADKFLAGFEHPDTSDSSHSTKLASHVGSHSTYDPDSPLDKGSDPLKSAETDKFLAGFLGSR